MIAISLISALNLKMPFFSDDFLGHAQISVAGSGTLAQTLLKQLMEQFF